jgi:pimeloyl-ACP methyl ester carboxylesterase
MFHGLGMNVLAVDLRCHGESGGRYCSVGVYERDDLGQVVDQLRRDRPDETRQIVLFGVSLGAAVVAATSVNRSDIAAVILECPYADFCRAAVTHARVMGAPGGAITNAALHLAQWLSGADFSTVRPVDLIPRIPCPLMIIRGDNDFLVDEADAAALKRAAASRSAGAGQTIYWEIPNCGHVLGLATDPGYQGRIKNFVQSAAVAGTVDASGSTPG